MAFCADHYPMFENRQGELSGLMDLKIEIEKGNNEQDKNKNKADAEETSRMLLEEFFFDSDHDEEYMGNQCL